MKKLIFAILILSSLNIMAQDRPDANPKLEALQNEKDPAALKQKIKALENGTADDLDLLILYYQKDTAKKKAVRKRLLKKYPESMNARMQRLTSFIDVSGTPEMETLLKSMIKEYPDVNLDLEKCIVACAYAEVPDTNKILGLINTMQDPVFKRRALLQAIDIIAAFDNTTALEVAARELGEVKKIKGQTALSEPLKIDPKLTYYDYINMYGKLLFKAGKNTEAYKYTTEAYDHIKNRDAELIENYAFLSSLNGKYEDALPILAKAVKDGKHDKRYIEQVRKGYGKLNPGKDVDAYLASLRKDFMDKIKAHVEKSIINETPPDFYIKDVNGNKVTLADFKGKTIVLDFWATWCGPCVASFPAMQMAVNRYKNDPDVKFLFIHTAEHVPDPLTDAKNFLAKRNYDFDLYMDTVDPTLKAPPALTAFKIDGIPMKYVIDANGKIRFKVSGFEGKDEEVAEEVVQMVELARKGA